MRNIRCNALKEEFRSRKKGSIKIILRSASFHFLLRLFGEIYVIGTRRTVNPNC